MSSHISIFCIGELLIDFFCTDVDIDLLEGKNFQKQAGGAPANVCAAIAKLGGNASFSGKVGNEPFGHFLKQTLDELNVDTSMLVLDDNHPTTLAFVSLKANGERDFVFNRGADAFLTEDEMDKEKLKEAAVVHFGSATALLDDPFQSTYLNTMKSVKQEGKFISFDPNFRGDLWKGRTSVFVELVKHGISMADFVKVSNDELKIITGKSNVVEGISALHQMGAEIVAVTLGKDGTFVSNGESHEIISSMKVKSVDSTGAGDAFVGAALFQLAKEDDPNNVKKNFEQLKKIISFSNKVGAVVCTKLGAIAALPTYDELYEFSEV